MPTPLTYRLRAAELDDLPLCLEIDSGYVTTHVWQMTENFNDHTDYQEEAESQPSKARSQLVGKPDKRQLPSYKVEFVPSRLPRPLAMPSPWSDQYLLSEWKRTDFLLVAEAYDPEHLPQTGTEQTHKELIGYVGLTVDGPRHIAWVTSASIQMEYRRRGIGTALFTEARRWADRYRLRSIMVELQTKNYPAIAFCQQHGFFFCGYNSSYYANREIALFFAVRLEKPR